MPHKLVLPSFAKINLGLRVLSRRPDSFHDLCTVFQTVSLHDTITISAAAGIEMTCSDPDVPVDDTNLVIRALKLMSERFGISAGARIHLEKCIPSPGGLGGGSSNAAVALLGFNRFWNINAAIEELHELAEEIGSDVPFFLYGGTALGTGRGTEIEPLPDIKPENMVIVTPNVSVSTKEAFLSLDSRNLTTEEANRILLNCRFGGEKGNIALLDLANDFEKPVFSMYPEIHSVKGTLLALGAIRAALSGSGASVYGLFDNLETRQTALKALGGEANWRSFAVAAISRSVYREALKEVF